MALPGGIFWSDPSSSVRCCDPKNHDVMCDDKSTINYNRNAASKIFKACLIACGVNKHIAHLMYLAVEGFQIVFCDWREDE